MATLYKKGAGNVDAANGWNSQADGLGTDYTASDSGGGIYVVDSALNTLDLNGLAVTLNQSVAAALIQSSNVNGYLDVSGTRTINGNVTYSSTSTSGMVRVGSGDSLTINGQLTNSSSGYCLRNDGTGIAVVSNVGGTAISVTASSGAGVAHLSSGSLTITGAVSVTAGTGIWVNGAATVTITGNVSNSGSAYAIQSSTSANTTVTGDINNTGTGAAVYASSGSVTIAGNATSTTAGSNGQAILVSGGTITWIGSRTVGVGETCSIAIGSGTLVLADGTGALALTCSGVLAIRKYGGTLTVTSGANNASLVRQIADAQIACLGQDISAYVSGPTIPIAANVRYGIQCGYAGALVTGDLQIPNSSSPTGTQDATSDDCVVSGKKYGSPERTGTAAGGGGRKTLGALRGT